MAEKMIRTCDNCDVPAETRVQFTIGRKSAEKEIDLCPACLEEFLQMTRNSRSVSGKRRHRAYQTRAYQDKTS